MTRQTLTVVSAFALLLDVAAETVLPVPAKAGALAAAVQEARDLRKAKPGEIVRLELADGVHPLEESLVLTSGDSHLVVKGSSKTLVSGAQRIKDWRLEQKGIVSAAVPRDYADDPQSLNQLWVNGRRASNSVWPKGRFLVGERFVQATVTNGATTTVRQNVTFADDETKRVLFAMSAEERMGARLAMRVKWTFLRQVFGEVDADAGRLTVASEKLWPPWATPDKTSRLSFENVRAGFTEPGDWFCDAAAGRIYYRLRSGESAAKLVALVPVQGLKTLVRIDGEIGGRAVEDVLFTNLTFAVSAAERETYGHQAADLEHGVIEATGLRGGVFADCRVTRTGGYAFRLAEGCVSNTVVRCQLDDLGAGGLWIGAKDKCLPPNVNVKRAKLKNDSPKACKFNVVDDCTIAHGGHVNTEGVGVVIGHASDCTVTHCEIFDFEYSGVSLGWIWGYSGSICQRNTVTFNHIHDLGKGLMDDLAGIYALSTSFGTLISNNIVHDVTCSPKGYGGWGLYCDEGAEGIVMEKNVTWNTTDGSFHQHYGTGCQIRNNIFAYNRREGAVKATNQNPFEHVPSHINVYCNIVLVKGERNPFVDPRTFGVMGPWACNLWWNEDATPVFAPNGMDFAEWQRRGLEVGGVLADPCFVDAPNHDFRLKSDSPAFTLGFKEWDIAAAGRRK